MLCRHLSIGFTRQAPEIRYRRLVTIKNSNRKKASFVPRHMRKVCSPSSALEQEIASFPGLPRLQFLIALQYARTAKRSKTGAGEGILHCKAIKNWSRGRPGNEANKRILGISLVPSRSRPLSVRSCCLKSVWILKHPDYPLAPSGASLHHCHFAAGEWQLEQRTASSRCLSVDMASFT